MSLTQRESLPHVLAECSSHPTRVARTFRERVSATNDVRPKVTPTVLMNFAEHGTELHMAAGRRVLLDGLFAQALVLITAGRGRIRCAGEIVAELGPGDLFGELAPRRQAVRDGDGDRRQRSDADRLQQPPGQAHGPTRARDGRRSARLRPRPVSLDGRCVGPAYRPPTRIAMPQIRQAASAVRLAVVRDEPMIRTVRSRAWSMS